MGCLAALSQFISRLGEKGLPLYRLLRKAERFTWTPEAQEALDRLKASLTHAPILMPPIDGEPLYLYVSVTTQVVSAVIVVERQEEGHALPVQRPVYYISEVCPKPRHAIRRSRSCYRQLFWLGASCATTSRPIPSPWSRLCLWER